MSGDRPPSGPHSVPSSKPTVQTVRMMSPRPSGPRLPPSSVRFPAAGDVLPSPRGTYTVERAIGQGAYGAVYAAIGPFDQRYALKLLVPANRPYAEVQTEWAKETERLLRLRHPNVVYMHDAFEADFLFYMALEWCSCSLHDFLDSAIAPELSLELVRQILAAVQYLHDHDIVHGDLHPGNVLIVKGDRPTVKLADFGISQELHGSRAVRPDIVHHGIMAPEVAKAGYTSRQSDIYQVGLLLYWMFTGSPPIDYDVPYAELLRQVNEGVPRVRAEALGSPIGKVIAKMLRRREEFRYAGAREVWDDLKVLPDWKGP